MKRQVKSVGNVVFLENNDPISAETEQIQSRIRQRAYELSQERGHAGREVDDWCSAESEIISVPPVEVVEKNGEYHVQLAVAGIRPEAVTVMASIDQMLVKCDSRHDHDPDAGTIHVCDFKSATVFRSIRFPHPIDPKSVETELRDGILHVVAAREGVAQASRKRPPARKSAVKGIDSPTMIVGTLNGGINTNVVPDKLTFRMDRRMTPEENPAEVEARVRRLIESAVAGRDGIRVEIRRLLLANALKPLPGHEKLVEAITRNAKRVLDEDIPAVGVPLYADARLYGKHGVPIVMYGAGPRTIAESNAKRPDENLLLEDLRRATQVVAGAVYDLLHR